MSYILTTLILVVAVQSASATSKAEWSFAGGPWTSEWATDVAIGNDPRGMRVIYVASTNGDAVFKTSDDGGTWTHMRFGRPTSVVCDKDNADIVYVGTSMCGQTTCGEVWKSTDGGASWARVLSMSNGEAPSTIAVSPLDPLLVYVGTQGGATPNAVSLWRSVDGGENWEPVAGFPRHVPVTCIALDPSDHHSLFVGTMLLDQPGLIGCWRSTDGGTHWLQVNNGLTSLNISSLCIDPLLPSTLYAGVFEFAAHAQGRLFRSDDRGDRWVATDFPTGDFVVMGLQVPSQEPSVVFAGVFPGGIHSSTDMGATWQLSAGMADGTVLSLKMDSHNNSMMVAGTSTSLYMSTNGGVLWTERSAGMHPSIVGAVTAKDGQYLANNFGSAMFHRSEDHGKRWMTSAEFDGTFNTYFFTRIAHASEHTRAFATRRWHEHLGLGSSLFHLPERRSANSEFFIFRLYRSYDAGLSWQRVEQQLDGIPTALTIDPNNEDVLYMAVDFAGMPSTTALMRSSTGGDSWERMRPMGSARAFAIDPSRADSNGLSRRLFLGGGVGAASLLRSDDAGATWTELDFPAIETSCIAVDPTNPANVYVATLSDGVYRSSDGGDSWGASNERMVGTPIAKVICDPNNGQTLFALAPQWTGIKVYASINAGRNWEEVCGDLASQVEEVNDIAVDHAGGTLMLLAGTNRGIYTCQPTASMVTSAAFDSDVPSTPSLHQNYPNPFNPTTTVQFSVPGGTYGQTSLRVYDVLGREVATLVNEVKQPGTYTVQWDGSGMASGVYLYKLQAGHFHETRKLILLR